MQNEEAIIALLQEQNQYLKSLYELEIKKQKEEQHKYMLQVIINILPFLILAIIAYIIYSTLTGYIQVLNNNINTLRNGFETFAEIFQKLIPDFGNIKNSLQNTWENLNIL